MEEYKVKGKDESFFGKLKDGILGKIMLLYMAGSLAFGSVGPFTKKVYAQSPSESASLESVIAEKPTLAVLTLDSANLDMAYRDTVSGYLRSAFVRSDRFTVLNRANMEEILKEQELQITGCTSTECVIEIGKILSMQYMIAGSVTELEGEKHINVDVVNVETTEIEYSKSESFGDMRELQRVSMWLVAECYKEIIGEQPIASYETASAELKEPQEKYKRQKKERKPREKKEKDDDEKKPLVNKPIFWMGVGAAVGTILYFILRNPNSGGKNTGNGDDTDNDTPIIIPSSMSYSDISKYVLASANSYSGKSELDSHSGKVKINPYDMPSPKMPSGDFYKGLLKGMNSGINFSFNEYGFTAYIPLLRIPLGRKQSKTI